MQNKNIFEKILAITDTSHICSQIITNYRIANDIKDNDFKHVYVVYGLQENQPVVFNLIFMTFFGEYSLDCVYSSASDTEPCCMFLILFY
jgi:hypothetical protein